MEIKLDKDILDDILGGEAINTLAVEATDGEIHRIAELANKQLELERGVTTLELELKAKKEELRSVQEHDLPDALAEAGVSEIRLADGSRVKAEPFVTAHISKAKADEAHMWLIKHGFGDIIKREVTAKFGKNDDKWKLAVEALQAKGIEIDTKEAVHHSTLRAFAKEQMEQGTDIPVDLFGLYSGFKSKIAK
tara:strand:+ start:711 stop:1289 length:579 start_codon:yes stop_codon:yes gene_type:complete